MPPPPPLWILNGAIDNDSTRPMAVGVWYRGGGGSQREIFTVGYFAAGLFRMQS